MDLDFFIKEKTKFIKYFYEQASAPFINILKKIENEEEPFIPVDKEDLEPPFLEEWENADKALDTLGYTVLSLLSSSLEIFIKEWEKRWKENYRRDIKLSKQISKWEKEIDKLFKEMGKSTDKCPANLEIIEQIKLGRNRIQHLDEISSLNINWSKKDITKYPTLYFSYRGKNSFQWPNSLPKIHVSKEKIYKAIEEVEKFCIWMEKSYWKN